MPAAQCRLYVTAAPGAARDDVGYTAEGELRVRLAAPAREGKANRALLKFLAQRLDVPPTHVSLVRGERSRHKVVEVQGMTRQEALARLGLG